MKTFGTLFALLAAASLAAADDKKEEKKKLDKKPADAPAVIQLDASKLPPELLKKLVEAAGAQPAKPKGEKPTEAVKPSASVKTISLGEAIGIAEKQAKGTAAKAERKDHPEVHFKIEVVGKDGAKTKVELTADGKQRAKKDDEDEPKKKK
ncbi:MAG: hypothetical protein JNM56_32215 [Planctomycetia bacterium]|nr:hypothetical protein [Planctomycetia bacterium]